MKPFSERYGGQRRTPRTSRTPKPPPRCSRCNRLAAIYDLCSACYDQVRQLTPAEAALLERRTDVPARQAGEPVSDWFARALKSSTPREA